MLWCALLFAFHQELGPWFVDIKTYLSPAFARGQCQFWWESRGKGKTGMFVCLPAIWTCSDCERPGPLLDNIIHQGGLRPDTGENCLYTRSLSISSDAYPLLCWKQLLNAHTSHCCNSKHKGSACLNSLIDSCTFWYPPLMERQGPWWSNDDTQMRPLVTINFSDNTSVHT